MKVAGLIAEYNPFHNGHQYHIDQIKKITGADYCIAVMSGDFVQRGAPAIIDKYCRTEMALRAGIDLIIELPVCYATASAEYFALGAVSIMDKLGIVDTLCFGSECGDIVKIRKIAQILCEEPDTFKSKLLSFQKGGLNYPTARIKALEDYLSCNNTLDGRSLSNVLNAPNNILGIEYVKAIYRFSSSITPVTIQRNTAGYHEQKLSKLQHPDNVFFLDSEEKNSRHFPNVISSATAIRNVIRKAYSIDDISLIADSLPEYVFNYLYKNYNKTYPITEDDFASIIKYKLLSETSSQLTHYLDITVDLARRMKNLSACNSSNIEQLSKNLKTKNITLTRINRALIHLLLNIHTDSLAEYGRCGYTFYARILGLKKESSHLLRKISYTGNIPIIAKVSRACDQLDSLGMQMLSEDLFAAHLYNQAVSEKYKFPLTSEYKHNICIL